MAHNLTILRGERTGRFSYLGWVGEVTGTTRVVTTAHKRSHTKECGVKTLTLWFLN